MLRLWNHSHRCLRAVSLRQSTLQCPISLGSNDLRNFNTSTSTVDKQVTDDFVLIGDVKLPVKRSFDERSLVPFGHLYRWGNPDVDGSIPADILSHWRWMGQKRLLNQDMYLIGPPTPTRRQLVLALAELCGWECEYLSITRDTTESDLKQRREIVGDSVIWSDAAPVRAAIHGRVLILDGLENAERNVLPTLNNLLENREMMLEDGRFLMRPETIQHLQTPSSSSSSSSSFAPEQRNREEPSNSPSCASSPSSPADLETAHLIPVHEDFIVIALGLPVPPYPGRTLDPPLRSRFQSRFIDELPIQDALNCVDASGISVHDLQLVASVYEGLRTMRVETASLLTGAGASAGGSSSNAAAAAVPCFTLEGLQHCFNILRYSSAMTNTKNSTKNSDDNDNDNNNNNNSSKPTKKKENSTSVAVALSRSIPLGYEWRTAAAAADSLNSISASVLKGNVASCGNNIARDDGIIASSLAPKHRTMYMNLMESVAKSTRSSSSSNSSQSKGMNGKVLHKPTAEQPLTHAQSAVLSEIVEDLVPLHRHVCLMGPKGSGKSFLVRQLSHGTGVEGITQGHYLAEVEEESITSSSTTAAPSTGIVFPLRTRVFPLFQEMAGRDLLQRRSTTMTTTSNTTTTTTTTTTASLHPPEQSTTSTTSSNTKQDILVQEEEGVRMTMWLDSPLIEAARNGDVCVLDGIDRVEPQALLPLRRLLCDSEIDLPSGERLHVHPNFRVIALATTAGDFIASNNSSHSSSKGGGSGGGAGLIGGRSTLEDMQRRYLHSDLGFSYHWLPALQPTDMQDILTASSSTPPSHAAASDPASSGHLIMEVMDDWLMRSLQALYEHSTAKGGGGGGSSSGGGDHPELRPSLRHVLRIRSILQAMTNSLPAPAPASKLVDVAPPAELLQALYELWSQALLVRFQPSASKAKFELAMKSIGLEPRDLHTSYSTAASTNKSSSSFFSAASLRDAAASAVASVGSGSSSSGRSSILVTEETLQIGSVSAARRRPQVAELVPQPLFHETPAHLKVLEGLLLAYNASYNNSNSRMTSSAAVEDTHPAAATSGNKEGEEKEREEQGERRRRPAAASPSVASAMLLIGNQGVGKNKLVDRLLQLLNAEREYLQLHRDTTIQSLTLIPVLEGGHLTYQDSPLVRAVTTGRILVMDEADKAPLEVICLLRGLLGDGELVLVDGRRLLSADRAWEEYYHFAAHEKQQQQQQQQQILPPPIEVAAATASFNEFCAQEQIVPIHPDFRMIVLANRPGHPFQGNHFYRECGDLFASHIVENLDIESEIELLQAFAPSLDKTTLIRPIAKSFADLRALNENGVLNYPFSAREAVAVVKHLHTFPQDSVETAVEDILGFEAMNPQVRMVIAEIFQANGFQVANSFTQARRRAMALQKKQEHDTRMRILGGRRPGTGSGESSPRSRPRTGVNLPKHGQEDPDNKPHVGGNNWAGGTGGSDTAGLGGRGGPYRLPDKHNPLVHQISDEDKANVSEESRRMAAAMAKEAFQKRLDEIAMGEGDYETYQRYLLNIQLQAVQLREILHDVLNRRRERVWLRNQQHGDLDDARLVDGLAGDRRVFKRRGMPPEQDELRFTVSNNNNNGDNDEDSSKFVQRMQIVVDVSGSMIRFNGMDRRLERMLEASLMLMEALPRRPRARSHSYSSSMMKSGALADEDEDEGMLQLEPEEQALAEIIDYSITGHSGETAQDVFIDYQLSASGGDNNSTSRMDQQQQSSYSAKLFKMFEERDIRNPGRRKGAAGKKKRSIRQGLPPGRLDERDKMTILEKMVAHAQFCSPGDNTLRATQMAIDRVLEDCGDGEGSSDVNRTVIILSDANFDRYGIDPADLSRIMRSSDKVKVHIILIAGLHDEADRIAQALPIGSAHLCLESSDLPSIMRRILASSFE